MRTIICIQCNKEFQTESKRKDKRMCNTCLKQNKTKQVMLARKRKNPNIEIGVGSGNSSVNKTKPLTQHTYRKVKKNYCELCNSTEYLCVHHIDGNRQNNSLENLITVCKHCHQTHHVVRDEFGKFTRRNKTV